jgi:hypothetical protein
VSTHQDSCRRSIAPEKKIAQVQVTEILNVQKNHDRFHPSRSELREWYLVADSGQKQVIEAIVGLVIFVNS